MESIQNIGQQTILSVDAQPELIVAAIVVNVEGEEVQGCDNT